MKKNRGAVSGKEKLSLLVKELANKCRSLDELAFYLKKHEIKPYYRYGILAGIWIGKRKLRLTTLGVGKMHLKELTKEQKRLGELKRSNEIISRDLDLEF